LRRGYSVPSALVVDSLHSIEEQLAGLQRRFSALQDRVQRSGGAADGTRDELAKLHGEAHGLVTERIDAVTTAELNSGRADARAKRRELVGVATELLERTEQQVKALDAMRVARARRGDHGPDPLVEA